MTESAGPLGDAAELLRTTIPVIASMPPTGLPSTLGIAWAVLSLVQATALRLAELAPGDQESLYNTVEGTAGLALQVIGEAPSTPPFRAQVDPAALAVPHVEQVKSPIIELTAALQPLLAEGLAIASNELDWHALNVAASAADMIGWHLRQEVWPPP